MVDAADARRLLRRRQIVGLAGDVDVERDGLHVLGVEAERVIDGLERYPLRVSEDRGDGVDELGEVRDPHLAAVTDEPVQVRGDRQRVREIVALLEPADPILVAARPVPHVPLVERDVNRMRDALELAHALDERRADADRALGLVRREHRRVVVSGARVEVDRVEVDQLREPAQDDLVPLAPAVLAAADELDGRIGALHHHRECARFFHVVVGVHVPDLPAAVHLVAEAPVPDAVRLGVTVGSSEICPRRVAGAVAVLDPRLGFVHRARAHVDADIGLGLDRAAVLDELVGAEAIRLLGVPGELGAPRPLVPGADAIEPVIAADEVAARPAQDGDAQRAHGVEDVGTKAARVGERGAFVVDPAVDAAAEVLDELAEDAAIDGADAPLEVDADARHAAESAGCRRGVSTRRVIDSRHTQRRPEGEP